MSQTPTPSVEAIKKSLNDEKFDVNDRKKRLAKLAKEIQQKKSEVDEQQAIDNKKSKYDYDQNRFVRGDQQKQLRKKQEEHTLVSERIEESKQKIKTLEENLTQAQAMAAQEAAVESKPKQSKKAGSSGDVPTAQKRKGTISENETSPKRQRTGAPPPPPTKIEQRKGSRPYYCSKPKPPTAPIPPEPRKRWQLSESPYARRMRLAAAAAGRSTTPACSSTARAARPARRQAPEESEEKPEKKRQKADPQKRSKTSGVATNSAAPSPSTAARGCKRSAPVHDEDEEEHRPHKQKRTDLKKDNDRAGAKSSSSRSKSSASSKEKVQRFRGLKNWKNACFSNSVIQLFDAAFEGHDIDKLLGKPDKVKDFSLKTERRSSRHGNNNPARAEVEAAVNSQETKDVSPNVHLRNILQELHRESSTEGKTGEAVSPHSFQSAIAYSCRDDFNRSADNPSVRQKMSGDTQQDCHEYYQCVLDRLAADTHLGSSEKLNLKNLFEVQTTVTYKCSKKGCDYESEARAELDNFHNVPVPQTEEKNTKMSFADLYNKSKVSSMEGLECPKCSAETVESHMEFSKLGDNLVMRLNRVDHKKGKGEEKIRTPVNLDIDTIRPVDETQYDLSAVICHFGTSSNVGHYKIFRKHDGHWYILDDESCEPADCKPTDGEVKKWSAHGESAMLLWKKANA